MRKLPLLMSLPALLALFGVGYAEPAKQQVSIRFALEAGKEPVNCSHDIKGLGSHKISAKLHDARLYISAPVLIDKAGKEVPIELEQSDWQYANVALLAFADKTDNCVATTATNDSIKGVVPAGRYKGFSFVVGVPSVVKGADGKDIVLNHSNFATAPAPLDLQSMSWNWQAGRKFIKLEIEPDGGVTRQPMKPRAPKTAGEGGGDGALMTQEAKTGEAKSEGTKRNAPAPEAAKPEPVQVNADGTITVKTWMLHLGSTGCKGDALTGEIVSCASPNRIPVTFAAFDPAKQQVALDMDALLAGIDLNHDAGGATGCMSGQADPECAPIWEKAGLNLKETAIDANDAGKPAKGAAQQIFRVEAKKLPVESRN
jgi:hypothetical protein